MAAQSSIINVAPQGDFIFVAGDKKLRVSSTVLRDSSKYFEDLLDPIFDQGRIPDRDNPEEIQMPAEDAYALEFLCKIAHSRNDAAHFSPKPRGIYKLVIGADKYECAVAQNLVRTLWLKPRKDHTKNDLTFLMATAYVLDDAHAFSKITWSMAFACTGPYTPVMTEVPALSRVLPMGMLFRIGKLRSVMRYSILQMIAGESMDGGSDEAPCTCSKSARSDLRYRKTVWSLGRMTINKWTVKQTLERIRITSSLPTQQPKPGCAHNHGDIFAVYHREAKLRKRGFMEEKGLCLDCAKRGSAEPKGKCRLEHGILFDIDMPRDLKNLS